MLSDDELLALLTDMESDRVERKASLADPGRIRQAICAFANDLPDHRQPGVLFVGVSDDGTCANLPITDELLKTLAHMRSDGNILPLPMMTVQKRVLANCEVAVIEVQPSYAPPMRYDGRVWIRVGPRRAIASAEEERRLTEKRRARDLPFDQSPVPGATMEDLDLDLFSRVYLPSAVSPDVLAANDRSLEQQLASLRFLGPDGIPNVGALLVFGKDPIGSISGAYVQFLRIDGLELTDPIQRQKEIAGPMPEVLRDRRGLECKRLRCCQRVAGPTELRSPDYPIVALQQLVRNAVLHRTYETSNAPSRVYWFSDRIEIRSPGGLYGHVTPENFGEPGVTDYRNPLLAEAMRVLGFVQRFGLGIPLARNELQKNGNPPLELSPGPNSVLVTVRRRA